VRLAIVALALAGAAFAAPGLTFFGGASADYDGNVFQYSARDESLFVHRAQPSRFPFRSLDDVVIGVNGRLTWRTSLIAGHTSQFGVSAVGRQYVSNPVKSYLSGSVRARQYLSRNLHFEANYLLIPRYLIRYYRDPAQSAGYAPCALAEHLVGLEAGWWPLRWLELAPTVRYEIDRYQAPFEFYNSTAWRAGVDLRIAPLRAVGLNAAYEFKASRTRPAASPDISYDQHDAALSVKPRLGKAEFEVGGNCTWRGYTATAAVDSTHAGRVDVTRAAGAGVTLALSRAISVVGSYRFERRNSTAPYRADIDEVKDYAQSVIALGIRAGGIGW
jgi:hypothetical protein